MAKKAELLEEAQKLGLEVSAKNTIAEIQAALEQSSDLGPQNLDENDENLSSKNEDLPSDDKVVTAKAGKRSEKGIKAAEEKTEKIERQHSGEAKDAEAEVKKGPAPKTRSKLDRRSKAYKKAYELVDRSKEYTLSEASELLPKTSTVKFDASVELHVNLAVDPRQADQNIRATVALPHGSGKTVRIAVFAPIDQHEAAKNAGADIVMEDEFLQKLDKEELDFDVLIATPQFMPKLGKYARTLGPKGLMPNPKSGTVTTKVADAVKSSKAGKVEFRIDKQSIIHLGIGKTSFKPEQITDNAKTVLKAIADARPASVKGAYIEKVSLSTTMGPSVKVALSEV